MNFFIAFGMFFCYGIGCAVTAAGREVKLNPWLTMLLALPFEVGAYFILASQVGLHF